MLRQLAAEVDVSIAMGDSFWGLHILRNAARIGFVVSIAMGRVYHLKSVATFFVAADTFSIAQETKNAVGLKYRLRFFEMRPIETLFPLRLS